VYKETYDAMVARLQEVNAVVETLDESIRADAFSILRPYIDGKQSPGKKTEKQEDGDGNGQGEADTSDLSNFFSSLTISKPSEAAYAIAAWLFSQYGSAPFTISEIRELGAQLGYTIPDRIDKTLAGAKDEGKSLFRKAGRGLWGPTVQGELWFKSEYKVAKGKQQHPAADSG
jgi:hypothetical protein